MSIYKNKDGVFHFDEKNSFHREDGPALEFSDGAKEWYVHGKRHRIDGPAVEYADGTKYWYVHGKEYSEEKHKRLAKMIAFL